MEKDIEVITREDGSIAVIVRDDSWKIANPRQLRSKLYPKQECFVCHNEDNCGSYIEFNTPIPPFVEERTNAPVWVCDPCLREFKDKEYCCTDRWDWERNERIWTYDDFHS
jgi:hypothetical protein